MMKTGLAVFFLLFFLPAAATAQGNSPAPDVAVNAPEAETEAEAQARAYYHYTLGHMYEEMAQLFRRSDYMRLAIEEYREALEYDPDSAALVVELADAYRRSGRIQEAVREARQVLEKDPDNLAAHRLLGHVYYQTLGELRPDRAGMRTLGLAIEEYEQVTRLAPRDTEAWLTLARLRRMNNDIEGAEAALKKLLEMEPQSEQALAGLALLYSDQGDYEEAIALLEEAAQGSSSSKLLASLAYAYEQAEDYENAIQTYHRALRRDQDNLEIRRRLAETLLEAERLDEALAEYRALAEAQPDDAQLYMRISQIYRHQHRYEEARAALEQAKRLAPDSLEIGFQESFLYEVQGDFEGAIEVLTEMVARMTRASGEYNEAEARSRGIVLERLGVLHREVEDFDAAVEVFQLLRPLGEEQAQRASLQVAETLRQARRLEEAAATAREGVARFPEEPGLKLQLANLVSDLGDLEQAVQIVESVLEGTDSDRRAYLALTQIYEGHKRYPEAEEALAQVELLSGSDREREQVHFLRGALYERQKEYERAEEEFRRVLEMNPESAITLNYLGYMLADNNTKLEEAVKLVERALEIEPYNGAYLDSLGWAYFRLEQYGKAEEYLLRAVERLSRDPTIHDHLGDLYYATGRLRLALKA
ncbi:MAG: tetratricopeptide repeat protein, partial [Terriglobia bacterium]